MCALLRGGLVAASGAASGGPAPTAASEVQAQICAERMAVTAARERANAVRREAQAKRRTWAQHREEEVLFALEGRLRAEQSLRSAQRDELASVQEETERVRAQLASSRKRNDELRATLSGHQEMLRRLRSWV
mmetsp:Transcript_55422/g.160618  ORF Transcript_55422/g.160618 Transcript_55422/m.160618 type:complete len:133 (+) Transcript_55422:1-399(+)